MQLPLFNPKPFSPPQDFIAFLSQAYPAGVAKAALAKYASEKKIPEWVFNGSETFKIKQDYYNFLLQKRA